MGRLQISVPTEWAYYDWSVITVAQGGFVMVRPRIVRCRHCDVGADSGNSVYGHGHMGIPD
jgi:hypothetical protein